MNSASETYAEDFVRFRDVFELFRGVLAALVPVWVVLQGEFLVRALDGVVVGVAGHAESLVKVGAHACVRLLSVQSGEVSGALYGGRQGK